MQVLQDLDDPANIYVSTRSGRDWVSRVAVPLAIDDGMFRLFGLWRYGDVTVELPLTAVPDSRAVVSVEVRVWQQVDNPWVLYISARGDGGSWATVSTVPLRVDDGTTPSRRYRRVDLTVEVPFAGPASTRPPVTSPATLVGVGNTSAARQAQVRAHLDHLMTFHADRYGLAPMPFTLIVAADSASASTTRRDLTGGGWTLGVGAYTDTSDEYGLFVIYDDFNFADAAADPNSRMDPGVRSLLAHEYFHVLQSLLSGDRASLAPSWLVEGTAEYGESRYQPAGIAIADTRIHYSKTGWTTVQRMRGAAYVDLPLSSLERNAFWGLKRPGTHPGYDLGLLAVGWLVERAGEDSYIEFWKQLADSATWEEAFERAFGMTAVDFYRDFEDYRRETLPRPSRIQGVILGPDGAPVPRILIYASEYRASSQDPLDLTAHDSTLTSEDGTFELRFLDGMYAASLEAQEPSGHWKHIGWYSADGFGTCGEATLIVIGGADVTGLEIRLPAEPSELPDLRPEVVTSENECRPLPRQTTESSRR